MTNIEWIAKGNTGCCFATLFAKSPEKIGWEFIPHTMWEELYNYNEWNPLLISIIFPKGTSVKDVKFWALNMVKGFYIENTSDNTEGLRIRCKEGVAWVQYFGPDSHVKTRQSPYPMLMYTNKLAKSHYIKVGFNGILHLAHAWVDNMTKKTWDLLWNRSFKQTKKIIGHDLGIEEASKTTFLK